MPYFPKSQITTNLSTNGDEFVYLKNKESFYVGPYYKTSTNKFYTGVNPSNGTGVEIVKVEKDSLKLKTDNPNPPPVLSGTNFLSSTLDLIDFDLQEDESLSYYDSEVIQSYPNTTNFKRKLYPERGTSFPSSPSSTSFVRYYVKKGNELIYFEVSKETYSKLKSKDPSIAFELFECLSFPYSVNQINSDEINRKVIAEIERNNKWYGFLQYFNFTSVPTSSNQPISPSNGGGGGY